MSEKAQFGNAIEFILTVIGFSVGLGNVWRFPALVFDNGGGPFLVIFFLMLFLVGIPMFLLELSIGQFSGLGPSKVFYRMAPITQGIGYAALIVNAFIGFYYNVIIAYCFYYLIMSMRAALPWASCDNSWNNQTTCAIRGNLTCEEFKEKFPKPQSPSEQYFYNGVLKLSDSINNIGSVRYELALCLLACWLIVFAALSKGVQSLGKVSYVTATFPYIVLTILVITGCLLEGAGSGINFYLGLGTFDWSKFAEPSVWKAATGQVFFALGTCMGSLIAMSSLTKFNNNILRDTLLIPILDCLTGFYAGFAIFSVLGYMAKTKCVSGEKFADVVKGGPELAFIVYPEGLSLMKVAPLFSCLFFIMMLMLGFGSEFSFVETVLGAFLDAFKSINTSKKKILARFLICMVFCLLGLLLTTEAGFFFLTIINEFIGGYPLLVVGLLEVIVVPWIYGTRNLIRDIESMIGEKPKWLWAIFVISWNFICPIMLTGIIVLTMVFPGEPMAVNEVVLPAWANALGWIIAAIPLITIVACAAAQIYYYECNWKKLFKPDKKYYEKSNKFRLDQMKEKNEFFGEPRNNVKEIEEYDDITNAYEYENEAFEATKF